MTQRQRSLAYVRRAKHYRVQAEDYLAQGYLPVPDGWAQLHPGPAHRTDARRLQNAQVLSAQ